jgi:hypothetical protein
MIFVVIGIIGCASRINQVVNHQREGRWKTTDTLDFVYISKGKYHKGKEIGTWKYFYNGKIVRKEKYHDTICNMTFYHPNGKIMKQGKSKTESNSETSHWYYFGKWHFYNTKGKLDSIKEYQQEIATDSLDINMLENN